MRAIAPVRMRSEADVAYHEVRSPPIPPARTDSAHILVRQVMARPALTLDVSSVLVDAAALMQSHRNDHVPVTEEDRLVGLVTRGDLVTRMLRVPESWRGISLAQVMTREVVTVGPAESLREASRRLIESHHGGLPVVGEGRTVVGFLAARDLLQVLVKRAPLSLWV